jgi:hypothetical protein
MAKKAVLLDVLLSSLRNSSQAVLASGTIEFYDVGTSTAKDVYEDRDKNTSAGSTITLGTDGSLLNGTPIFLDGLYKMIVKTSAGATVATIDGVGDGHTEGAWIDATAYSDLDDAITAIGATETDLLITEQVSQTGNVTVPANVSLLITNGGSIDQGANTLTINGPIKAGPYRIFDGAGAVTLSSLALRPLPEWWNSTNIPSLANEATPSVKQSSLWLTGGTTTVTDFDDGFTGQVITVVSEHAITITNGTNIFLDGDLDFVMAATDTLSLICKADNKWYESSRSINTSTIPSLADNATPTIKLANRGAFLTGGTTTITDFDDGAENQVITIIAAHTVIITEGTNIFLKGSTNWTMLATDTLTLIQKSDGKWYEISRSQNRTEVESLNSDTAISLNTKTTLLDSSGGVRAWTLADGVEGQIKYLLCTVAGNNGVVTVATLYGGNTTLTFNAADEAVYMKFTNSEWNIISNVGSVAVA